MWSKTRCFFIFCITVLSLVACLPQTAVIQPSLEPPPSPTLIATIYVPATTIPVATWTIPATTPTPVPTSTLPVCKQLGGRMETGSLVIEGDSHPLEYRVYLPPCYDSSTSQYYPVLYLIHGQNYTDDQWDRLGIDETIDTLTADDEIPPFIIVMPRDYKWDPPDVDPFGEGVIQVLVPYIDENFRTIPDRSYRAIGGLSRGAGWAMHIGLKDWQYFSSLGLHSLAVLWGDVPDIKRWLDVIPPESMPRIYIDIGNKDFPEIVDPTLWFEGLLSQRGIAHEFHFFSGEHVESYWKAHIEQYLRWYAALW